MKRGDAETSQRLKHAHDKDVAALAGAADWEDVSDDAIQKFGSPWQVHVGQILLGSARPKVIDLKEHKLKREGDHRTHASVEILQAKSKEERSIVAAAQACAEPWFRLVLHGNCSAIGCVGGAWNFNILLGPCFICLVEVALPQLVLLDCGVLHRVDICSSNAVDCVVFTESWDCQLLSIEHGLCLFGYVYIRLIKTF